MTIEKSVVDAIQRFENSANSQQIKKLEEVHELFEKLVKEGFINRPTYDLAPISTLPSEINFSYSSESFQRN